MENNPTSANTTYVVVKKDLKISVNAIKDVKFGENVTITGKFTDADGVARANVALKVFINGKSASTRTNSEGVFTLTSKVGVLGINNVTVTHNGGANYNPVSANTTFKMVKQDLKITVNPISQVKMGNNVTITGKFTDANNVARTNSNVKIYINDVYGSAKTNSNGVFTYSAKVTKVGVNNVTLNHNCGTNYDPTSTNNTFAVVN